MKHQILSLLPVSSILSMRSVLVAVLYTKPEDHGMLALHQTPHHALELSKFYTEKIGQILRDFLDSSS